MRNQFLPFVAAGVMSVGLFLSTAARADAIAPDEEACTQKAAGADCVTNGAAGHCTNKKCSRLDYSDGSPPSTKEVDCLVCVATGVADAAPPSKDDSGTGSTTNPGNDGGSAASTTSSGGTTDNDDGCSLAKAPIARAVGPWLLAILPMALLRRRNKKQR